MDNGKADIIAGIRELKAKAAEQLTGNEYYMIVQQLDSLATSVELSDEVARSVFTLISARLAGSAPAVRAAGGPEVPETPDTPAQPDTPSTPDVPVVPDSPAQPDGSPGPEIPPPSFPAEPQTPPEVSSAPASAAGSDEPVQIVTPSANSFGTPQATGAIRLAEVETPSEPVTAVPEAAPAARHATGLAAAALATRGLIEEKLSGNSYYSAANLLGQLQILPPVTGSGEIEHPDGFEGALMLLRREAAHLSGIAHEEAARVIAALEKVLMPKPQLVPEKPAEMATPQSPPPKPEAAAPEPEPEPRTGFDELAEAAWKRVQQVSAADARPAAALNGSAAPAAAAMVSETAAPATVAEQAEMMAQDIGEAFDDGGSESRSSEPCYLNEFELAGAQLGTSDRQEPAAESGSDTASETERQAALSAETEALIALAETGAEPLVAVEEADALTVEFEEVTEPQASGLDEAMPLKQPVVAEAQPQVAELEKAAAVPDQPMPLDELAVATAESAVPAADPEALELEPAVVASEPLAEDTHPAAVSSSLVEAQVEPVTAAAPATSETADEVFAAEPAPAAQAAPAAKPTKRGFFGRLFGGASAENGR